MKRKLFITLLGTVLLTCGGALTGLCGDDTTNKIVAAEVLVIDSYDVDYGHYTDGMQLTLMQAVFRDDYDMDYGHYGDSMEPSVAYAAIVADYLEKCRCKGALLDAKSANIRKLAVRDTVKGAFVRQNQAELIQYLIENNVAVNPRRVEYMINQRFKEQVSPHEVYAALANEQTNN